MHIFDDYFSLNKYDQRLKYHAGEKNLPHKKKIESRIESSPNFTFSEEEYFDLFSMQIYFFK